MEYQLRTKKVSLSTTPAGLHEKKEERTIQTRKRRLGATKAALSCVLPSILEAEAYITVIRLSNVIPTKITGTQTLYEIFHNEKPQLPTYSFSTIALCYHPRTEDKTVREEIGIFISHAYNVRYLKFWIPHSHHMYSMRLIKPLKHQFTPPSWNYTENNRAILPLTTNIQINDDGFTTPNSNSQMESVSAFPTPPKAVPTSVNTIVLTQASTRTTAPENASSKTKTTHVFQLQNQEREALRSPEFNQDGESDTNLGSNIIIDSPQRSQTPIVISSGPSSAIRSKTCFNTTGIKQHFPSPIHLNDHNNHANQMKDEN
jgi:hypothetical protein